MLATKKIIISVVGIVLALGASLYFYSNIRKDLGDINNKIIENNTQNNTQKDKATKQLLESNKEAIRMAMNAKPRLRPADETDHIWGDLNAPVQLIIYDDFECPFCARFYDTVNQIKEHFGDKVVVVFRHFPLRFHPNAMNAALASECAAEQGKFWEMYDKIFADNKAGRLSVEQLKKDAKDLGLDLVKFNQCLYTKKYKDKIERQMLEGRNAGVTGTPGNFVNGRPVPGAYPFEDFKRGDKQVEGMKSIIESYLK